MAMFVHGKIWQNKLNRTLILSVLMVLWTVFIEFYFLFWPEELIKGNLLVGWLYTDIFGFTFLLDLFHTLIWGLCFFFTWMSYTIFKNLSHSGKASISEFAYILAIFTFFIIFINNILIAALFVALSLGEFFYLYYALSKDQ